MSFLFAFVALAGCLVMLDVWLVCHVERVVPPAGKIIEVRGVRLHYRQESEGEPILFLHGQGGQMRNFSYLSLTRLTKRHRVVLLDRPGSGYLSPQSGLLPGVAEQALASRHPALLRGLALLAPLTCVDARVHRAASSILIRTRAARLVAVVQLVQLMCLVTGRWTVARPAVFHPQDVPTDFARAGGGMLPLRPTQMRAILAELHLAAGVFGHLQGVYAALNVPVCVLRGRHDRIVDWRQQGEKLTQRLLRATLYVSPPCSRRVSTASRAFAATDGVKSGHLELAKTGHFTRPVEPLICPHAKSQWKDRGHMLPVDHAHQVTDWLLAVADHVVADVAAAPS